MGGKVLLADAIKITEWRNFFRDSGRDIFEIIERAIAVAAWSRGDEFFARRDHIAEILYATPNPNERLQLVRHLSDSEEEDDGSHSDEFFQRSDQITPILSSKKDQNVTSAAERTSAAVKACNHICLDKEEMEEIREKIQVIDPKKLSPQDAGCLTKETKKKVHVINSKKYPPQDVSCRKVYEEFQEEEKEQTLEAVSKKLHELYEEFQAKELRKKIQVIDPKKLAPQDVGYGKAYACNQLCLNEKGMEQKLEATKKKLQARYEHQAEETRKKIQVIDSKKIPPQDASCGKAYVCDLVCLKEEEMEQTLEATSKKLHELYEEFQAKESRKKTQVIEPKKLAPQDAGYEKASASNQLCLNEKGMEQKLEATKKKLQERYEHQAEETRKKIQVIDSQNIPPQDASSGKADACNEICLNKEDMKQNLEVAKKKLHERYEPQAEETRKKIRVIDPNKLLPQDVNCKKACNRICLNEEEMEQKLEATKKKLHRRYEQIRAEKTKKRIQVIDPKKLPPQDANCKKSKNQPRRAMRRRI